MSIHVRSANSSHQHISSIREGINRPTEQWRLLSTSAKLTVTENQYSLLGSGAGDDDDPTPSYLRHLP
jgi:hypothetical protein